MREVYACVHGLHGRSASGAPLEPPCHTQLAAVLVADANARASPCSLLTLARAPAEGESRAGGVGQDSEKRQGQEGGGRRLGQ
jgi:hypothetical protein